MKNSVLLTLLSILIVGCGGNKLPNYDPAQNLEPASVVKYTKDTNLIYLTDYLPTISAVDSVTSDAVEIIEPTEGWATFKVVVEPRTEWLSVLKVWQGGVATDLTAFKNEIIPTTITYTGKATKVSVTGQTTAWRANVLNLTSTDGENWTISFKLPAGRYQYQIAVDGRQIIDPSNPEKESNGSGGYNSVLTLRGADQSQAPIISTYKTKNNSIFILANCKVDRVLASWQNVALPQQMIVISDSLISIAIPNEAKEMEKSYLRVWASNANGISNDILVPLQKGEVINNPAALNRHDKHRNILYSLMIDRFRNGNPDNDRKLNQPDVLPIVDYMGGDLKGITQKIDDGFFTDLGVNTIWISPITQNPYDAWGQNEKPRTKFSGYHGYWPIYVTALDQRFGNDAELKEMLAKAHQNNINVILDYVANHMHINSPTLKAHPDWTTPFKTPDGRDNLELWDEFRLTTWFDRHIPSLDLERKEIYEPLTDSALYWVANYDFDGFRHDATKHIPEVYWRTLTQKIKTRFANRDLFQIGETYGSPELINSYVKSGMLDGQFDFNLYDAATGAIGQADGSMNSLMMTLRASLDTYGYHNLMGYITGNHDRPRFISLAGGSLSFGEDTKAAGWNRTITVGDSTSYDKLALLQALILTIPGVPTIYQGDEYGIPGGNDPDNRRMMVFDNYNTRERELKEKVKKLTELRRDNMAMIYGDTMPIMVDDNVMVFARNYIGNVVVVAINKSAAEQTVSFRLPLALDISKLMPNFGNQVKVSGRDITITLAPISYEVATMR